MGNFSYQMNLNVLRGKAYTEIFYTFFNEIPVGELQSNMLHLYTYVYYDSKSDRSYGDNIGIDDDGELALFQGNEMINHLFSFSTDTLCDIAELIIDGSYKKIAK